MDHRPWSVRLPVQDPRKVKENLDITFKIYNIYILDIYNDIDKVTISQILHSLHRYSDLAQNLCVCVKTIQNTVESTHIDIFILKKGLENFFRIFFLLF